LFVSIFGWTNPTNGHEYAIVGLEDGTAFVEVTNPEVPFYLGFLEGHDGKNSTSRAINTFGNYAYIVANAEDHGMQIFDLTQLSTLSNNDGHFIFNETSYFGIHFDGTKVIDNDLSIFPSTQDSNEGFAKNIVINEESSFAYLIGSNNCNGGLYMLNLTSPLDPVAVGCFSEFESIRDAQCVIYDGVDTDYLNSEICFITYSTGLGIVDVTEKDNPTVISILEESDFMNINQGRLTKDKRFFIVGDGDDGDIHIHICDVSNLDFIAIRDTVDSNVKAMHGNVFVKGDFLFQAAYRGGLRILNLSNISNSQLPEIGSFDTTPSLSGDGYEGVNNVYPFFASGTIIISSTNEGIFIVRSTRISEMPSISPSPTSYIPSYAPSLSPVNLSLEVPPPIDTLVCFNLIIGRALKLFAK